MKRTIFGLGLAAGGAAFGQVPEAPVDPIDPLKEVRSAVGAKDGDLSRLARMLAGKKGGNHLFYLPTHDEPATPAKWGYKFENVAFASEDGTPLHGWFMPAKGKRVKGTIVFSHGNAGAIGHHLGFTMWLVEGGYNVLMYDYRGFGKSGGEVDRRGMINDVKAAFSYIATRKDVDPTKLVSFGHSLGGAKSITALGETPVAGLKAIVIDGTFSSYQAMARVVAGQLGADLVSDDLSPLGFVGKLPLVPFLVVHGKRDEVVPFAQGLTLFETAHEPKTLFAVDDGTHGGSLFQNNGAYRAKMLAWLDERVIR
ncbi:MAG TPA: alpha/beta fold hydrolase [Luteolibacter sp.]|nr:alpha/beta fold hydrolase [Luteolibacter sp.]